MGEYKASLIVFPTKNEKRKLKKGTAKTASAADSNHIAPTPDATTYRVWIPDEIYSPSPRTQQDPNLHPSRLICVKKFLRETADGEKGTAYQTLRHTWATAHNVGRKFKPKEEAKGKKSKKKK